MTLPNQSNTPRPRSQGLDARIDTTYYRLIELPNNPPRIRTAPLEPPKVNTSANPEDLQTEFGTFYSLTDFTGGEGLAFAHREDVDEPGSRFWKSQRLRVVDSERGETPHVRLSEDVEVGESTGLSSPGKHGSLTFLRVRQMMAPSFAEVMLWTEAGDLTTNTSTSTEDPHDGEASEAVYSLAKLDLNVIYAALDGSNGVHKREEGVWSHWSDQSIDMMWAVKDRLLGTIQTDNNLCELYELASGAGSTLLKTVTGEFEKFTDVIDAGTHILAVTSRGILYSFVWDEQAGSLTVSGRQTIFERNQVASIDKVYMLSVPHTDLVVVAAGTENTRQVLIATHSDGRLVNAQVLKTYESGSQPRPIHLTYHDGAVWWVDTLGEMWKYDITTGALFNPVSWDQAGTFLSNQQVDDLTVSPFGNNPFFCRIQGDILQWRRGDSAAPVFQTGYLITPLIDHFTSSEKVWADVELSVDPDSLDGATNNHIDIYYSTNPESITDEGHADWTLLSTLDANTAEPYRFNINAQSRYITFKLVFDSGTSAADSPILYSLSVRAYPGPGDVILQLPINTSDLVSLPGRAPLDKPGLGDEIYQTLRDIEGTSVEAELLEPSEIVRGVVKSVKSPIPVLDARGSQTLTSMVTIQGRRTN